MRAFRLLIFSFFLILNSFFRGFAQQNFVNVPSCEETPEKKFFCQQQFNFNRLQYQFNTTIDYGFGHEFELGFNLFGFNYLKNLERLETNDQPGNGPLEPQILINGQKFFRISDRFRLGTGLQFGTAMVRMAGKRTWAGMVYSNVRYAGPGEKCKMVLGFFGANAAYSGEKNHPGLMAGFEFRILKKFFLVGDVLTGSPYLNAATLGCIWFPRPQYPVTFAWQMPWKESKNLQAFVLELTYAPLIHLKKRHEPE